MEIDMNIDKKTLDSLLNLPDDKLIQMIRLISGNNGTGKAMTRESIAGLRKMLSHVTDADISRATELIAMYKQGKKG